MFVGARWERGAGATGSDGAAAAGNPSMLMRASAPEAGSRELDDFVAAAARDGFEHVEGGAFGHLRGDSRRHYETPSG